MTSNGIPRDFWAEFDHVRGWKAKFQAPGIGVCTVRGEGRSTQFFPTQIEAEIAAARAKDEAEDRGRQPLPRTAKTYRPAGTGRNRRAEAVR